MKLRRFFCGVLAAALALGGELASAFPLSVAAAESTVEAVYGNFKYSFMDDGTICIDYYSGNDENVVIPDKINGTPVTIVGAYSFKNNSTVKKVTVPYGVTNLGANAFYYCTALEEVKLPDSLKLILRGCFAQCWNLTSVNIPDSVTSIDESAFASSGVKNIVLPYGIKKLYNHTFYNCTSLEKITIPDTVKDIGRLAFYACSSLKDIYYTGSKDQWNSITIDSSNEMNGAAMHYNHSMPIPQLTGLKAIPGSDSVHLEWDSTRFADGYLVEQYTDGKWKSIEKLTQSDEPTLTVNDLAPSTTYKFRVCAFRMNGSTTVKNDYKSVSATTKLTGVTGFKQTAASTNTIRLNWDKHATADGYIIEQLNDGKWTRLAKITGSATVTYRISGLTPGTEYRFRVQAYKMASGKAVYSDFAETSGTTCLKPVSGLKTGGTAYNALRLNWDKDATADGYIIEQLKDGKWTRLTKITSNATVTYRISGLAPATEYSFRIRTYKIVGGKALYSDYSEISASTYLKPVSGLKIGGTAKTALRLNWNNDATADGCIIEQLKDGKWTRLVKITSNATATYRIAGLAPATEYRFRIRTYKIVDGKALYSDYKEISGKTM